MENILDKFIAEAQTCSGRYTEPSDCVDALAPTMRALLNHAESFLTPAHLRSDPAHYA